MLMLGLCCLQGMVPSDCKCKAEEIIWQHAEHRLANQNA